AGDDHLADGLDVAALARIPEIRTSEIDEHRGRDDGAQADDEESDRRPSTRRIRENAHGLASRSTRAHARPRSSRARAIRTRELFPAPWGGKVVATPEIEG